MARVRYKDPLTDKWAEKKVYGRTKAECNENETKFRSRLMNGENMKNISLVDFFNMYVNTFKRGKISAGRVRKYELAAKYIETFFGKDQKLQKLTKYSYQEYLNWLASPDGPNKEGLSDTTIHDQHSIFKSAILEAIDMQYISRNPTRNVDISGRKATHSTEITLSEADASKLLNTLLEAPDNASKYFCITQFFTGARYQEIAALKWGEDLDEEREQIIIDEAFKYGANIYSFGETKTQNGIRKIDVPRELFKLLKKWKAIQAKDILSGKLLNPHNLLFPGSNIWPVSNSAINKYLKYWCNEAGVPRIRTHSFRHMRSDFLIMAESDPIYIQSQLGHGSIDQSYEYASATEDRRIKNKHKNEIFLDQLLKIDPE